MVSRPQLLSEQPRADAPDMRHLIGIAGAIESESVRRYAMLAQEMERRGEHETAATFRAMREMEEHHQDAVERWAERHHETVPPAQDFAWSLPPEIAASWNEVQRSSLLTPYRALAIAVVNEERAFALYAYIAARATDPKVAREAEMMAREELSHAAELRVRRRQAYRREHGAGTPARIEPIENITAFRVLEQRLDAEAATVHRAVAEALAALGDDASAALVDRLAREEASQAADRSAPQQPATSPESTAQTDPAALLRTALHPLEQASEIYEELIAVAPDETLLVAEQTALSAVVARIAALGHRIGEIDRAW